MEKTKEKALRLGLAVYRVTKLFPEGEVLISQSGRPPIRFCPTWF